MRPALGRGGAPEHLVVLDVLSDETAFLLGRPLQDLLGGKTDKPGVGRHRNHVVPPPDQLVGELW
jgi:hypothetical protein